MQDPEHSAGVTIHPSATSVVRFGRFFFDRDNRILSSEDEEISLPPRVLAILDLLVEQAGSVVSKDAIMRTVWKDSYVGDTSLTEAVSLLRQALEDDPKNPVYVQTVHRRGYRFVAPVSVAGRVGALPETAAGRPPTPNVARSGQASGSRAWMRAVTVVLAVAAVAMIVFVRSQREAEVSSAPDAAIRLDVSYPQGVFHPFSGASVLALSPVGDVLVFAGRAESGATRLYRRSISEFECQAIPGTEGAGSPFFSPDGAWIAFFTDGELRKTPVNGGAVIRICPALFGWGGTWADNGSIVFTEGYPGGLSVVPADGGEVTRLTRLLQVSGEVGHWWPHALPGGRGVLFTVWSSSLATARIAALDLRSGQVLTLIEGGSYPRYSARSGLFYLTPGGVTSVPFDVEGLEVSGPSRELADQPRSVSFTGVAHFDVAADGTMAYLPSTGESMNRDLVLMDDAGSTQSTGSGVQLFRNLRVSPSGNEVAVTILHGGRSDVWITPLREPKLNRLTFEGFNIEPRWSPDGEWVLFASNREGPFNIYRKPAGGGVAERLMRSDFHQYPGDITPDGRFLVFNQSHPDTGFDIWITSLDRGTDPEPLVVTSANEYVPALSPDGRWIVYLSDESGIQEVYIRSTRGDGGVWQVSNGGAGEAFWSSDGGTIIFGNKSAMTAVPVTFDPALELGAPVELPWPDRLAVVDALPDGRHFIAIKKLDERPKIDAVRVVVSPN